MTTETSENKIAQEANIRNGVKRVDSCTEQMDKIKRIRKILKSTKEVATEMDKAINWEGYGLALGGAFITLGQIAWGVIDVVHEVGPKNVKVVTGIAKTLKPIAETIGDAAAGKKINPLTLADRTVSAASGAIGVRQGVKNASESAKALKNAVDVSIKGHKAAGRSIGVEMEAKTKGKRNWEGHYKSLMEALDCGASLQSNTAKGDKAKAILAVIDSAKNVGQWAKTTYDSTTASFNARKREREMRADDIRKLQQVLERLLKKLDDCLNEDQESTGLPLV